MTAYRWNDPARTLPRRRLADRIRAEVGPETDSWASTEPGPVRIVKGGPLRPCGTEAAYQRHIYHKERPCQACREAHSRRFNRTPRGTDPRKRGTDVAERLAALAEMRIHDIGPIPEPGYITAAEAAERLGVTTRTIARYKRRLRERQEAVAS